MTRFYSSVAGTIVPVQTVNDGRRGLAAVLATILAAVALAAMLSTTFTAAPSTRAPSGDLTDGFLPGAIAANAAAHAGSGNAVTDGWAAGLVGSAGSHDLRDGWEGRITPSAAATEIRGGWEARLAD